MSIEDDEILQGFIEESLEHLADIENDLLAIEEAGADIDVELVNKVFRAAHSIKGGAGFMGLTVIQDLAHAAENVLGLIRSEKLVPNPDIINVLLMAADELQQLIENVATSNSVDISSHTNALNIIFEGGEAPAAAARSERVSPSPVSEKIAAQPESEEETATDIQGEEIHAESLIEAEEDSPEDHDVDHELMASADPASGTRMRKNTSTPQKTDTSIRVTVSLLDQLMNLAGELVLSRNQLLQTITSGDVRNAEAVAAY